MTEPTEDAIFAVIQTHKAADQRLDELMDTSGASAEEAAEEEMIAYWALFTTAPTTLAGFAALFGYLGETDNVGAPRLTHAMEYWSGNSEHSGAAEWLHLLALAMRRLAE